MDSATFGLRLPGRTLLQRIREALYSWAASLVVTVGLEAIVDLIHAQTAMYIGIGTGGASDPVLGRTDLFTPATEARASTTESQPTSTSLRWVGASITIDGTKTINEAGLFDGAGAGSPPSGANLWAMSNDFVACSGVLNDTLVVTANCTVANA